MLGKVPLWLSVILPIEGSATRSHRGGAMRACSQCGLSIGDMATFCAVCGALVAPPATADGISAPETNGAQADMYVIAQVVGQDRHGARGPEDAPSRRRRQASPAMLEAGRHEKKDAARSAALYREAALGLLEASADPLDHGDVRHDLLLIFDRLSLVLKREGLPAEALEEIDCAASLGLLDCQDYGVKGHREALRKRRESLRRALDGDGPRS
jgi:hypothetical protein